MVQAVNWDANRYGSVKHVLKFDSTTGNWSTDEQAHNYTGTYNFTALPAAGATTTGATTTGTTTQTTQDQTAEAFGDVKPHYWQDEGGKDEVNVFSGYQKEKEPVTELTGFFAPLGKATEGQKPPFRDRLRHKFADLTGKTGREWEDVDRALAGKIKQPGFIKQAWNWAKPLAIRAMEYATKRSGANQSFRGVAGLYNQEIGLMTTYGSTMPTEGNPTGDPRKDDAGYNIVSGAGNYNMLGTSSRRHNMLKKADIHEKNSKEWKDERDKIRADFEEEKKTKIENKDYNINTSGSSPKDGGQEGMKQGGNGGSVTPSEAGMTGTYDAGWT